MFNRSSMAAVIAELDCIISFITAPNAEYLRLSRLAERL
jgi:hypothetical protein